MAERTLSQFIDEAEEYRRHCDDRYCKPYNAVVIPVEICERLGIDDMYMGYRWFQIHLEHEILSILDRLLCVKDRLSFLRNDQKQVPWGEEVEKIIQDPRNWMEWVITGRCEAFRILPPGLVPVQPTFLDDRAIELYGGKGYSLEGKPGAAALWLEACAMADGLHGD